MPRTRDLKGRQSIGGYVTKLFERKKRKLSPLKKLKEAIGYAVFIATAGGVVIGVPIAIWFRDLFSPRTQFITAGFSSPLSLTNAFLLIGAIEILGAVALIKLGFDKYEKESWFDY